VKRGEAEVGGRNEEGVEGGGGGCRGGEGKEWRRGWGFRNSGGGDK